MVDSLKETPPATTMDGFKLVRLKWSDKDELMHYLMEHFIPNEPSARSLGMSSTDGWDMTEEAVQAALEFPYSYVLKNDNDEIIAVRIATVTERKECAEIQKCENDGVYTKVKEKYKKCEIRSEKQPASAVEMTKLISALESKIWDLVAPSTKKLLSILIISTHEKYVGKGLMRKLLTFDLAEQKRDGLDGAFSEATAYSSQKLFAKLGFEILYEIKYDEWLNNEGKPIFKCDDQTNCAQLVHLLY